LLPIGLGQTGTSPEKMPFPGIRDWTILLTLVKKTHSRDQSPKSMIFVDLQQHGKNILVNLDQLSQA
jgi:hypothetical protein